MSNPPIIKEVVTRKNFRLTFNVPDEARRKFGAESVKARDARAEMERVCLEALEKHGEPSESSSIRLILTPEEKAVFERAHGDGWREQLHGDVLGVVRDWKALISLEHERRDLLALLAQVDDVVALKARVAELEVDDGLDDDGDHRNKIVPGQCRHREDYDGEPGERCVLADGHEGPHRH